MAAPDCNAVQANDQRRAEVGSIHRGWISLSIHRRLTAHGKSDEAHEAYWTHFASVEHLDPISIGGQETEANWITTSMARNQVRSRYSLEALGWSVRPREPKQDWDGGVRIFLNLMDRYPELSTGTWGPYLSRWRKIAAAQI
jgi:hypothetical protein